MHDPFNAFCAHNPATVEGSGSGPLAGLTFGVKDMFDIAGYRTGNGQPVWLRTHPPATRTAPAVQLLLDAGARMVGKTHTDEMAYSLNGENVHYGTPTNPKTPDRIPGGSSSGSAVAVAGDLVDFALGTDCGGSVRLPASYCGIYGIRTSHGLVPADNVAPLAHSFDTVGWFAREPEMMRRVGEVLLPPAPPFLPKRLLIASDAFAALDPALASILLESLASAKPSFEESRNVKVYTGDPASWSALFRILQGDEIRKQHLAWVDQYNPDFGPGIRERFEWTRTINNSDLEKAKLQREEVARHLSAILKEDAILCLPTAPDIAPKLNTPPGELDTFRARAFGLLCIAGLARLPQVTLPLASVDGCPIGISLIGPRGCDRALLDWIAKNFR